MMLKKIVLSVFVLVVLAAAVPAMACNQLCHPNLGCITVGWTTWQACHMNGPVCVDDQVWDCTAPSQEAATVTLADIIGRSEVEAKKNVSNGTVTALLDELTIRPLLAGSNQGGMSCDCADCCRHPDTNRCITCPRPPEPVTTATATVR